MDPNSTIDPGNARRLLGILDLTSEAGKEDVAWALGIIHQIPGYEKASLAKASQDRVLREILIGIAREEIAPTIPRDMEALFKQAEEREKAKVAAKEKGEKETREFVEAAKKAATKAVSAPAAPAVTPTAGVAATGEPAVSGSTIPAVEVPKISVPVSLERGVKGQVLNARDRLLMLPLQTMSSLAGSTLAKENPELATAVNGLAKGWAWANFEQNALASQASPSEIKKLQEIMVSLPLPLGYRLMTGHATWADLSYAAFLGGRLSPAQIQSFVPSSDGSTIVLPPQSFVGGIFTQVSSRLLGRATTALLKRMIEGGAGAAAKGAAAVGAGAAAETGAVATGAAAGAAAGGGVFSIITAAIGAIIGWLASKIPDVISWLKRHAKDFGIAAFALIVAGLALGNYILLGLGGGLGALSLAAGGGSAISQGASGFLQALYVGLAALVLPSIAIPLVIAFVTLPVLVAIVFFIINTSAFVLPKQIGPSVPINPAVANMPADCSPSAWPVAGPIIQGPETIGTHAGAEAVDILADTGTPIKGTVAGTAHISTSAYYGKEVEITSSCNGVAFTTRYGHMSVITAKEGQQVKPGDTLGLVGNTGNSSQPHLHYEFIGLPMAPPFVPSAVSYGCEGTVDCSHVVQ